MIDDVGRIAFLGREIYSAQGHQQVAVSTNTNCKYGSNDPINLRSGCLGSISPLPVRNSVNDDPRDH